MTTSQHLPPTESQRLGNDPQRVGRENITPIPRYHDVVVRGSELGTSPSSHKPGCASVTRQQRELRMPDTAPRRPARDANHRPRRAAASVSAVVAALRRAVGRPPPSPLPGSSEMIRYAWRTLQTRRQRAMSVCPSDELPLSLHVRRSAMRQTKHTYLLPAHYSHCRKTVFRSIFAILRFFARQIYEVTDTLFQSGTPAYENRP